MLRTERALCEHLFILSIINSFISYFNKQPFLALPLRKPQNSKCHKLFHYLSQNACDGGIILPILQIRKLKVKVVKQLAQVYLIYMWQSWKTELGLNSVTYPLILWVCSHAQNGVQLPLCRVVVKFRYKTC